MAREDPEWMAALLRRPNQFPVPQAICISPPTNVAACLETPVADGPDQAGQAGKGRGGFLAAAANPASMARTAVCRQTPEVGAPWPQLPAVRCASEASRERDLRIPMCRLQDLHTAAIVSLNGTVLGTESFSTTRAGYRAMLCWFRSHGELLRVGVESTGSYGAGITRHLALSGVPVLEVTGPDRAARRAKGKEDALDAVAAAESARTGRRVQVAKDRCGAVEALRCCARRKRRR